MKNNSIQQQHIRNTVLLSAIVLLSLISTVAIEKVQTVTSFSSVIPSGNHNNNKTTSDNSYSTGSLGLIPTTPFYESNVGKIIGQRIVSTANGTPQIEHSIVENGTLKGVGNVTNLETWISSLKSPNTYYGSGKGVITTADGQKATWSAYGIGRSKVNGGIIYHDVIFFNNNSTGKIAFLNNLEGLRSAEVNGNKQSTKTWEWK
jgi:hypothetical protein